MIILTFVFMQIFLNRLFLSSFSYRARLKSIVALTQDLKFFVRFFLSFLSFSQFKNPAPKLKKRTTTSNYQVKFVGLWENFVVLSVFNLSREHTPLLITKQSKRPAGKIASFHFVLFIRDPPTVARRREMAARFSIVPRMTQGSVSSR